MVLVEPRKHPAAEFVLRNLRHFLPAWTIVVVHGTENEAWMRELVSRIRGRFELLSCRVADLPNPAYNTLFTLRGFWQAVASAGLPADSPPRDWVLVAQTDTLLMQPADGFLQGLVDRQVAFTGAPWSFVCGVCSGPLAGGCGHMIDQRAVASLAPAMVGNGGLSFRHVPSLLRALEARRLDAAPHEAVLRAWGAASSSAPLQAGTTNEDVFFCKTLREDVGAQLADRATALAFAIEQVPPLEWAPSGPLAIGAHKPWAYLPDKLVAALLARVSVRA